jgi:aminoglycoside phosphotransferase (APT) family kinase protein
VTPPAEDALCAGVRELIAEGTGSDPGALRLSIIPGGASRETFLAESDRGRWVLRRDPVGAQDSFAPLETEFRVVQTAAAAGVPVARGLAFEPAGGRLESAGFVMDHVEGTSVAPRVLRREELESARSALPAVEVGLRWLRLNPPPPPPRECLVHGDFRLGNLIVDESGLAAVIDWELCHSGDPAEDIGWVCVRSWRFGNDDLPVAGVGALDELLAAYEAAGGEPPSMERIRWWEAMGNVKWAVICARQAHDHLTGSRPSAELASLGRRISEPEWDLLELLPAASCASRPGAAGSEQGRRA